MKEKTSHEGPQGSSKRPSHGNDRKGPPRRHEAPKQHARPQRGEHSTPRGSRGGAAGRPHEGGHSRFPSTHKVEGTIRVTAKGVGYVEIEGMKDDIEIAPAQLHTALDYDRVEIVLYSKIEGQRQQGEVVNILLRNKTAFTGVINKENGTFFLFPDDQKMYRPILIPEGNLNGAQHGDKAYVEMTKWTSSRHDPLGSVKTVLGKANEHNAEMSAIALERGFLATFDAATEAAAEAIPAEIPAEEIAKRLDLRPGMPHAALTFTIDPKDAKDFDDALSFKALDNGKVEVGVHIADVSYYVRPGTPVDQVAVGRATSVYLVDRTIPMLPERLSNNLCSLVPDQDRLTFSVIFTMDQHGTITDEWFGRTIIHSEKRFSYEEAQEVIDTKSGPCVDALLTLNNLAKQIRVERMKNGAIEFEAQEVKFELDANGKPLRVHKKVLQDTNKLIEEFMLLANKHVAQLIAVKDQRAESVFVYRVHDAPNEDRLRDLREFLDGIGFPLKLDKDMRVSSKSINTMLREVRGHAEESMIQMATVRAMAKAVYTTKNIGHFGLGFEYYTHFTSPIRRYPDLMVHRLLANYLEGKPVPKEKLADEERLARYCSQMEVQAAEAERASIRYKQCEYFSERIGAEINGTISGVTEWGLYIEDEDTKTEGMVHVKDIPDDYYFFDQKHYRMTGRETGVSYRLGDKVKATIFGVDLKRKQIAMRLVKEPGKHKKA